MHCLPRPLRPWVIPPTRSWRFGEQLEIGDRFRPVTHGGTNAVIACITSTNNDHVLAFRIDVVVVLEFRVEERSSVHLIGYFINDKWITHVLLTYLQILHGKMNAVCFTVWYLEIPRPCRTGADHQSVILRTDLVHVDVLAYVGIRNERLYDE